MKHRRQNDSNNDADRKRKRLNPIVHEFSVRRKYLEQIRSGLKTIEGQPGTDKFKRWNAGELIRFVPTRGRGRIEPCLMEITKIQRFPRGFRQMLEQVGVKKCLPHLKDNDIDRGVREYHSFGNYKKQAATVGAVAFTLSRWRSPE